MSSFEKSKKFFLEGIELYSKQNYKEAVIKFTNSLKLEPNRPSILLNLSKSYLQIKQLENAKYNLEKIIQLNGFENEKKEALNLLLNIYFEIDDFEEIEVLKKIDELNNDDSVSGILVQLPLPKHIDKQKVIEAIMPEKDVDGFHPMNVGNLSSGYESSIPCTPLGCYLLIKKIEPNLNGKKAVIVGRSNLNGKPMTQLLLKENCTVTITHSKTNDLKGECLKGDIIVAAVGIPELVKGDWVKKDAIVIDVGINKTENGLVGDVAFDEVSKVAKALTPVPGGVGPMTIACLLKNTIECFKRANK